MAQKIHKVDGIAYGIMALGALNSGLIGLARMNMISKFMGRRSFIMRGAYAIIGLSAIYKMFRILGPKTKHEQRLLKIDKALTQLEQYEKKAKVYGLAAEAFKHRFKNMKSLRPTS